MLIKILNRTLILFHLLILVNEFRFYILDICREIKIIENEIQKLLFIGNSIVDLFKRFLTDRKGEPSVQETFYW